MKAQWVLKLQDIGVKTGERITFKAIWVKSWSPNPLPILVPAFLQGNPMIQLRQILLRLGKARTLCANLCNLWLQNFMLILPDSVMLKWKAVSQLQQDIWTQDFNLSNCQSWWISGDFIHATQPTVNLHFPMVLPVNKSNQQNQPQAHQLYWSLRRVFAIPTDTGVCPSTLCFECHCFWKPKWRWFRPILFKSQRTKIASYLVSHGLVVFKDFSPFSPHQPPLWYSKATLDAFFLSFALGPATAAAKCLRTSGKLSGSARRKTGGRSDGSCDFHIIEIRAPISWVIALKKP